MKAKAFDIRLFKRILKYTKPYTFRFRGVILFAVLLSLFAALRPMFLQVTVDAFIKPGNFLNYLFAIALVQLILALFLLILK